MSAHDPVVAPATPPVPPPRRFSIAAALSLILWLCVATVYATRPDAVAAITLVPLWLWLLPGLLLAGLALYRRRRVAGWTLAAVWMSWTLLCADETPALLRSWIPADETVWKRSFERGQALRVVSVNCGDGGAATLRELGALAPDIILSQESPGKQGVADLAGELFGNTGTAVAGPDAAILVHGEVLEQGVPTGAPGNAVWARVKLASGPEVLVVSLRLEPCPIRLDLWSAECWSSQRANRQVRRRQLAAILEALPEARGIPVIVGGDFNAPAGDPVFREFPRGFRDAFRLAGRGWGDTIVNQVPLQRIDQIWIDRGLLAANAGALRTRNSDHRLVWADLERDPKADVP